MPLHETLFDKGCSVDYVNYYKRIELQSNTSYSKSKRLIVICFVGQLDRGGL